MAQERNTRDHQAHSFAEQAREAKRVIGTYLFPYHRIGAEVPPDFDTATAIVCELADDKPAIHITRNGGLLIEVPEVHSRGHEYVLEQLEFSYSFVSRINCFICELALLGVVTEPASLSHVGEGHLAKHQAAVRVNRGGREMYSARTTQPWHDAREGALAGYKPIKAEIIEHALHLGNAARLKNVSELLPYLVAASYSAYSVGRMADSVMSAWIAIEQLLDDQWSQYLVHLADGFRQKRLKDNRTYSAAVRLEVLRTADLIDAELYTALNLARKVRNDLAHRAKVGAEEARETMMALHLFLACFLGNMVALPEYHENIMWG